MIPYPFRAAFAPLMIAGLLSLFMSGAALAAQYKIVIHVNDNEAGKIQQALVMARNVSEHFERVNTDIDIAIIAIGGGVNMFIEGRTNYGRSIWRLRQDHPNVSLIACGNTLKAMADRENVSPRSYKLLGDVDIAEVGAVALMEMQRRGYTYIRP